MAYHHRHQLLPRVAGIWLWIWAGAVQLVGVLLRLARRGGKPLVNEDDEPHPPPIVGFGEGPAPAAAPEPEPDPLIDFGGEFIFI